LEDRGVRVVTRSVNRGIMQVTATSSPGEAPPGLSERLAPEPAFVENRLREFLDLVADDGPHRPVTD
jgi:hypothetical protein